MQNVRKLTKPEIGGESRAIFLDYKVHAMYKIKLNWKIYVIINSWGLRLK